MHNLKFIVILVLCLKYISCTNSACTTGSTNTGTPKQKATCTCYMTSDTITGCTDVAITNMTWTGTKSISCEREVISDPAVVMRCFGNYFVTEGAGSSAYILIVIAIVLCLFSFGAFLWQRKTSNRVITDLRARISQLNNENQPQYGRMNMDNQT